MPTINAFPIQTKRGTDLEVMSGATVSAEDKTLIYDQSIGVWKWVTIAESAYYSGVVFDTPAQAALASLPVGAKYSTKGGVTVGDGGHGDFIVSATAPTTEDGYSCFEHVNGTFGVLQPVNGRFALEQFGMGASASGNAAAFVRAVLRGAPFATTGQYEFDFDGSEIVYYGFSLDIDLGLSEHTFRNFGGIAAESLKSLSINALINADAGYFKGLIRCHAVEAINSKFLSLKNAFIDQPLLADQCFIFEVSGGTSADKALVANFENVVIENIITATMDFPNATPMTFFGGYGSSSTQVERHQITIKNLRIVDFYSVDQADDITVIGADSDVFRLFTNPTTLTLGSVYLENVGKRFIKTQEAVDCSVDAIVTKLDGRFTTSNYNGTFEGQDANSGNVTTFTIGYADIDYARSGTTVPSFFNASGLPHRMVVNAGKFTNFGVFINGVDGYLSLNRFKGDFLSIGATASDNVFLNEVTVDQLQSITCLNFTTIDKSSFGLVSGYSGSGFPIVKSKLRDVIFSNWDTNIRVTQILSADNVTINYTNGSSTRRALWPINGATVVVNGLRVNQTGGVAASHAIESPGAGTSGRITIRDFRSDTVSLGFINTGSWDVRLDNCDSTVTGAGVSSLLTANYS